MYRWKATYRDSETAKALLHRFYTVSTVSTAAAAATAATKAAEAAPSASTHSRKPIPFLKSGYLLQNPADEFHPLWRGNFAPQEKRHFFPVPACGSIVAYTAGVLRWNPISGNFVAFRLCFDLDVALHLLPFRCDRAHTERSPALMLSSTWHRSAGGGCWCRNVIWLVCWNWSSQSIDKFIS